MKADVFLDDARARIDDALQAILPSAESSPQRLHAAMRYSVLGGGKRIRPALVLASTHCCDGQEQAALAPALAVELIHAYSLVHDDLPAMDDDDLRRGQPTCHVAFDEATAILAGDALQSLAFEQIVQGPHDSDTRLEMVRVLSAAAGHRGMVGGQALDLAATGQGQAIEDLERMHRLKTGALIEACVSLGALAAGRGDARTLACAQRYGKAIGLAFQVKDDLLDVEASTDTLGKPQGSDLQHNKSTYCSLLGIDRARELLTELRDEAIESLAGLPGNTRLLEDIAAFVVARRY